MGQLRKAQLGWDKNVKYKSKYKTVYPINTKPGIESLFVCYTYTCNSCIVMQFLTQIVYKNYIGMLLSNPYIVTKGLVLSNMQGT